MCEALYEYFADVFGRGGTLHHSEALRDFLVDAPRLSAPDFDCYEGPITVVEVIELLDEVIDVRISWSRTYSIQHCFRVSSFA